MSRKGLIAALVAVGTALAVTLGILIGIAVTGIGGGADGRGSNPAVSSAIKVSTGRSRQDTEPASQVAELTSLARGTAAANIACMWLDTSDVSYWTEVVAVHGVDIGKIKENPAGSQLTDTDRRVIEDVHSALGAAATFDGRWTPLQELVVRDEDAAVKLWDGGGLTVVRAATKAVGNDLATIHGICQSAKTQLASAASARGENSAQVLREAGATANQISVWQLWAA